MRVVVAPDSFGGTLSARAAADAIVEGWARSRPDDELVAVPLSDGGDGLIDVLHEPSGGELHELEVAGPHGKPVRARWLVQGDTAYIEMAEAAGLHRIPTSQQNPLRTTTYGVGQLMIEACEHSGVARIVIGLGGSATVDGGAGALTALGLRLLREGDNGLKVGGGELHHLQRVDRGWLSDRWDDLEIECWTDVTATLLESARIFGPQKGATEGDVELLRLGLARFADVMERDLDVAEALKELPGTGAAGGLGYGLAAALKARLVPGARAVAAYVGLLDAMRGADVVITGEGAIDGSSLEGKVVGYVAEQARAAGVRPAAVVGRLRANVDLEVEEASPTGPGADPAGDVVLAAARLASRWG